MPPRIYGIQPDPFAWASAAPALTCWAFLKDGVWTERGEMGWFGMSTGDKPAADWETTISTMVAALPEDCWVTVVDCHI